ncbi:hypothetical protein LDENG_00114720 [Lucifuga dentata]|nr:hypothetical protein LDENG_00114720 [Lucifuga dentata]
MLSGWRRLLINEVKDNKNYWNKENVNGYKWTDPKTQSKMRKAQDLFCKNMKRKSTSADESSSSLVSVPTTSERNLSESSKHKNDDIEQSQLSQTLSTETHSVELPDPVTFDLCKTHTLTIQSSSPQEKAEKLSSPKQNRDSSSAKSSPLVPDLLYQTFQDRQDDQKVLSSGSTPTPPESASPQLDQLLLDLEEMKLQFKPETLDPLLSESSDESPEADQPYELDYVSHEDRCPEEDSDALKVSGSDVGQLAEDSNQTSSTVTVHEHLQAKQTETEVVRVTPDLIKTQTPDISSEDVRPKLTRQYSEQVLTPVDSEVFAPLSLSAEASSSSDEYNISPGYEETSPTKAIYNPKPPRYTDVIHSGLYSPIIEDSDTECFFDCKQAASDLSETELDEPETKTRSNGRQPQDHSTTSEEQIKMNQKILLSSGSEDYDDVPHVNEASRNAHEETEKCAHYTEASDEDFTFFEAPEHLSAGDVGACDDNDKFLSREITTELGPVSESSDEEFLTTRIVRRRVIIQTDEMPDLPPQSVTEEKYKDENGHIVVKRVTHKIIRKCASLDGVEREEVSLEGTSQGSINVAEGDAYSKVVKRTVVKSEGDHTKVTIAEGEGFSASGQKRAEGCKVSRVEKTTMVEGERTVTHHGDQSLTSDLPSAQDDFQQGPHA